MDGWMDGWMDASKTLLAPEFKYTDCKKELLAMVWAVKTFSNNLGGQRVITEIHHLPVTFLNSHQIRECIVTNVLSFHMAVRYTQNCSSLRHGCCSLPIML